MAGPHPTRPPGRSRWHRLVEHYTPDGALGRSLLALATGSLSGFSLWMAAVGFVTGGFIPTLVALAALGATFVTALFTVVTLWPVYLSLIGNVPSAAAYGAAESPVSSPDESDDPIAALKHQYALGEVSQDEFERRLDDLLRADERVDSRDASTARDAPDRLQETASQ